jgi:cytochrome c
MFGIRSFDTKLIALAAVIAAAAIGASAEELSPSAAKGRELTQTLCSSCHLVGGRADSAVPAGIPTFRGIANKPGQTGQHIADVLMKPHLPMPDMQLTRGEITNIILYLETLRSDKSVPQLIPPPPMPSKPLYPEPT